MYVSLNLGRIKIYLMKLATDFYLQLCYLLQKTTYVEQCKMYFICCTKCRYAECRNFVCILSAILLSVVAPFAEGAPVTNSPTTLSKIVTFCITTFTDLFYFKIFKN